MAYSRLKVGEQMMRIKMSGNSELSVEQFIGEIEEGQGEDIR